MKYKMKVPRPGDPVVKPGRPVKPGKPGLGKISRATIKPIAKPGRKIGRPVPPKKVK